VTLPSLSPGTYYLLAQADTNSRVDESHEGDNLRTKRLRVGPDLLASIALQPETPISTSPTTITVTTTNTGFDVAAASTTQLYRSTDATVGDEDTLLQTWSIAALNPKQASDTSVSVTLPPGTYYLLAVVDATNVVTEANEAQNVKKRRVVVQ
jgi:subtilase family serine protease